METEERGGERAKKKEGRYEKGREIRRATR